MKIVLSGGGTGGHIYPALALRKALLKHYPHAEFLYIGTEKGLESRLVKQEGIPFEAIKVQGIRRSVSLENLKTVWQALTSLFAAKKLLKNFQPDIVIGTGGYVCGPVLYAASQLKIPTIIHEQNSVAGITNKLLAKKVDNIAICFEEVRQDFAQVPEKIVLTGNPRGQEIVDSPLNKEALTQLGLKEAYPTVLVFGGSRGAENLNQTIVEHYEKLQEHDFQMLFVTGEQHFEKVNQKIIQTSRLKVVPYINNMTDILRSVDLIVCRSGATTLSELTALGKASILVPSPYVTNNHQEKNARALVNQGAATMVLEKDLQTAALYNEIVSIMKDEKIYKAMGEKAYQLGIRNASDRFIGIIDKLVTK